MAFNFEKFTYIGKRYAPQISIRCNGAIGISQGAIHQAGMEEGDNWHVILHYDRAQKALGIHPTNDPKEEGAIKLSIKKVPSKEGRGMAISAFVSAKSFLNYYHIPHSQTEAYEAKWDPQMKMLITFLVDQSTKNEPAATG